MVCVSSGQHTSLLQPFLQQLDIKLDHDLEVMTPAQSPNQVVARVLTALDPLLVREPAELMLVQGDTTTALAGALAAFYRGIPVGHVEAGLRSGNPLSPFPEEMNRRLITQVASYHFAPTTWNKARLIGEGVDPERVFVTGNPGIDALKRIMQEHVVSPALARLLESTSHYRRMVLTTHRRESFGETMAANLHALREFVEEHGDVALLFPVHPNPKVRETADGALGHHPRIHLIDPLSHEDFVGLMARAWLLVSDSGGVQEEAPTLGKPLIVLRENTERFESVQCGVARLTGNEPDRLRALLLEAYREERWTQQAARAENPFGKGDSGERIARAILQILGSRVPSQA
jgi:UDP-N-acetylglucosamine 2-epimerase (non-hydrolysing)